jgi:hypothetical protein
MKKHYFKFAFVLFMFLFGAGIVIAQQGGEDENIINAAYHKTTGALRLVKDGKLKPNEVPLSWNIKGPRGDDGACSCPFSSGDYNDMLARIANLEEALSIISDPGDDFEDKTIMVAYEEINLDVLGSNTTLTNFLLSKVSVFHSNEVGKLWITSKEAGFERIWLTNYPFPGKSEADRAIAVIEVDVKEDGTMDLEILPWTEGAFRDFSKYDLNLPDIENIEYSRPDIVIIDELSFDHMGSFAAFARLPGETVITFTGSDGYEASIEIVVDENRVITGFNINPSNFTEPPLPDLFVSFSVINWDEPNDLYLPGTYNWDERTAPSLSADMILEGRSLIQELEPGSSSVEFSILSERKWESKWDLGSFELDNLAFNIDGDLKIEYSEYLRGGIYVEINTGGKTISATHDISPECSEGAKISCFEGPEGSSPEYGICQFGERTCKNGEWSGCIGQILPEAERCDGIDNNCNGDRDEDWLDELGSVCSVELGGRLFYGDYICKADGSGTECRVNDYCSPNPCDSPPLNYCITDKMLMFYNPLGTCAPNPDNGYNCEYGTTEVSCAEGRYCLDGVCSVLPGSCNDGIKNQDETDVDCGGSTCSQRCWTGQECLEDGDCHYDICEDGICIWSWL